MNIDVCMSEGCPFECTFCEGGSTQPQALARPETAACQLWDLATANPQACINIEDTCFFSKRSWYLGFLEEFPSRINNLLASCIIEGFEQNIGAILLYENFPGCMFASRQALYSSSHGTVYPEHDWSEIPTRQAFLTKCSRKTEPSDLIPLCENFVRKYQIRPDINWRGDTP